MSKNGIAQLVFFVAFVIAAVGVTGTVVDTAHHFSNAVDEHGDQLENEFAADVTIVSDPESGAVWNGSADRVTVLVKNVGEERLPATPETIDVVVDDELVTNESVTVVSAASGWYPGEVARIRFDRSLSDGQHRLSVAVEGGRDHLQFATGSDPVAAFTIDPSPARVRETITFDGTESSDPDGEITEYRWDLDADGTDETAGETATESWSVPGTVTVTLTVTDDAGRTDSVTRTIQVYPTNWRTYAYWRSNAGRHPIATVPTTSVSKAWGFDLGAGPADVVHYSSPAVVNDTVYVGSDDGTLYAVDASNGSVRWQRGAGGPIRSSPAVVNGTVFVGSTDDRVYAFDATTGSEEWNYSTGRDVLSPPTVENGVVFVGSNDDAVYALHASNGTEKWSYPTGGDVVGAPAVRNGTVYVGSRDGTLYAIDSETGTGAWSSGIGGDPYRSSPTIANGTIYVGTEDPGRIVAVNASSHDVAWNASLGDRVYGSPTVVDGRVLVGDDSGTVHALYATNGSTDWTTGTDGGVRSSIAVANGTAVVTTQAGSVYAVDVATGDRYWRYDAGNAITSSPAVLNGTVFLGLDGESGDDVVAIARS